MNPELQRNLWLELPSRRVMYLVAVLAIIFAATLVTAETLSLVAEILFLFFAVLWGTRAAAQAVVGEIRERTWDGQRLSSVQPWTMVWGKLFGATAFQWLGALICLGVLLVETLGSKGPVHVVYDLVFYLSIGLFSQATALLASLVAIRRRASHSRLDVFIYQLVGLLTAFAVYWAWQNILPGGWLAEASSGFGLDVISWWRIEIPVPVFYLATLTTFFAWALVGCHRLMREELMLRNGPLVWIGFLVFVAVYQGGFDAGIDPGTVDLSVLRAAVAAGSLALVTYAAVLLEPKDAVELRWVGRALVRGNLAGALSRAPGWAYAYAFTAVLALYVFFSIGDLERLAGIDLPVEIGLDGSEYVIIQALGFLARDIAIFLFFAAGARGGRGDFGAIVALLVLYGVAPALLTGLGGSLFWLFAPVPSEPVLFGLAAAWGQAAFVWMLVIGRLGITRTAASKPAEAAQV